MKFDALYEELMLELRKDNPELRTFVQKVFRGKHNQVSAVNFGLDTGKYVYAAIFQNGDSYMMLTMDKENGKVVLEAGSKSGDRAKKEFRDLDVARKYIRKELIPGLRIDNRIASLY